MLYKDMAVVEQKAAGPGGVCKAALELVVVATISQVTGATVVTR